MVDTWLKHIRQHARVTRVDKLFGPQVAGMPIVTYFVYCSTGS
jgi:hypothetical protein